MNKLTIALGLVSATAFLGCGGGSAGTASSAPATPQAAVRTYQATASVGDFLTISVDPNSNSIAYTNHSNNQTGTVAYTVGADGSYDISTANGGLIKAYEIPGFALVANANNTGPASDATSLVTAIIQAPISVSWIENKAFNYMQWRTSQGGMGIGNMTIDGSGNASGMGYWAYGAMQVQLGVGEDASAFNSNNFPATSFTADPSGNFLTLSEGQGNDTIFATQAGFFVVDNPNGSIIGVPQAASGAFDPTTAGTYHALAFTKTASMGGGSGTETGVGSVVSYTLNLSATGVLTVTDAGGNTVTTHAIKPVAQAPYLMATGTGQLPACPGLFTYRVTNGTVRQDVYLEFIGQAILFCSYTYDTSQIGANNPTYSYFYGIALNQAGVS